MGKTRQHDAPHSLDVQTRAKTTRKSEAATELRTMFAWLCGRKRGQVRIAKWPEGCSALLVPDPFSSQANTYAIHESALALADLVRLGHRVFSLHDVLLVIGPGPSALIGHT
jgi:hypothetical protein